jgi:hypothetical protein
MTRKNKYRPKEYWTYEVLKACAIPFTRRIDFKKGDNRAYNIARKRGPEFMDLVCSHMDLPLTAAYADEELLLAAKSYNSRNDFLNGDPNAYHAAHKRGKEFIDSICIHMELLVRRAYTDEELNTIALQYERAVDFKNGNSGAYSCAYDRGPEFLKKICSHMKKGGSKPEKIILEEVQKYFPTAKKFRVTKLKIPGKEYIKTLEVDVLVPELGLAIEFDGRYHHSLAGLKRGHPTWPQKHIVIYHEIKDAAFLELGIRILHIKGAEWAIDPQECIRRCLDFLEIKEIKVA